MAQIVFDLQSNVDLLSGSTFKAWQGTKHKNIAQERNLETSEMARRAMH